MEPSQSFRIGMMLGPLPKTEPPLGRLKRPERGSAESTGVAEVAMLLQIAEHGKGIHNRWRWKRAIVGVSPHEILTHHPHNPHCLRRSPYSPSLPDAVGCRMTEVDGSRDQVHIAKSRVTSYERSSPGQ